LIQARSLFLYKKEKQGDLNMDNVFGRSLVVGLLLMCSGQWVVADDRKGKKSRLSP
jgi:hypothetical protein